MGKIVAICNQKGGAGKTTTTFALSAQLRRDGYSVLCVDGDQQGSLSFLFGADAASGGTHELLMNKPGSFNVRESCVQSSAHGDIVCADKSLVGAEIALQTEMMREFRMDSALGQIREEYDYILIDTPPALSLLMLNALVAADEVIIPTTAAVLSAKGMLDLLETIEQVKESCNEELRVAGIVVTQYRSNIAGQQSIGDAIGQIVQQSSVEAPLFNTRIRLSCVVDDAQQRGMDITDYRSGAPVATDYKRFACEYIGG